MNTQRLHQLACVCEKSLLKHKKYHLKIVIYLFKKKLSNVRNSGTDDKVKLASPIVFGLEEALEDIQKDEYVEFTVESIRLRKIYLDENKRTTINK